MDLKIVEPGPRKGEHRVYQDTHVVFYDASWDFYEALLKEYDGRAARITFDRGTLEIITLSIEHERYSFTVGEMVSDACKAFRLPMEPGGSATLKLLPKQRGLESDQCFWIANEKVVRGIERLDLGIHPAPDLVIEVDVTHATVDRDSIYGAIGVPEMWHFDTQTWLTAWELQDGTWNRIERSKSFPMLRVSDLNPFLQRLSKDGHSAVILDFNDWLRALPR